MYECTYDACATDADCGAHGVCACGMENPYGAQYGRTPNTCLTGNCQVDADCGEEGYCSPSYQNYCGAIGVVGYFCHRQAQACTTDKCVDDGDCGSGSVCSWDPTEASWMCVSGFCAG